MRRSRVETSAKTQNVCQNARKNAKRAPKRASKRASKRAKTCAKTRVEMRQNARRFWGGVGSFCDAFAGGLGSIFETVLGEGSGFRGSRVPLPAKLRFSAFCIPNVFCFIGGRFFATLLGGGGFNFCDAFGGGGVQGFSPHFSPRLWPPQIGRL